MNANEKPGLLEQDRADGVKHDEILSRTEESVKSGWLTDFRVRNGLKGAEIVEAIRSLYPKFDKPLLSKCEHPDSYGVQLSEKAKQLLIDMVERRNKP